MRIRDPLPHRRTRHLTEFLPKCQGKNKGIAAGAGGSGQGNDSLVHTISEQLCKCLKVLVGPRARGEICCEINRLPFGMRLPNRFLQPVVHSDPPLLHKLSTDLSFVDNFGRGVQSRSKHHTDCVAQRKPGWSHGR
jgi:hypothetical protein